MPEIMRNLLTLLVYLYYFVSQPLFRLKWYIANKIWWGHSTIVKFEYDFLIVDLEKWLKSTVGVKGFDWDFEIESEEGQSLIKQGLMKIKFRRGKEDLIPLTILTWK
ncbi:MAG: hypothetical protein N2235_05200 [Fischerella sp.]|nr:hypothetical protein [Fischerella sp.]